MFIPIVIPRTPFQHLSTKPIPGRKEKRMNAWTWRDRWTWAKISELEANLAISWIHCSKKHVKLDDPMCSNDSSIQAAKRLNNSPPNQRFTERITNNADTHVDCTNYTGGLVNCAAIWINLVYPTGLHPSSKVTPVTHVPHCVQSLSRALFWPYWIQHNPVKTWWIPIYPG
jgi:hypothetical protein